MSPARYEHTRIVKIIYDKIIKHLDNKTCEVFQDNLYVILEYIIIDTKNNLIEQYTLKDGKYVGNVFILFKKDDLENLTENEKNLYTDIFKSTSLENFEMNLNEIF